MSGDNFTRRYLVVADARRRWSEEEKQAIIGEALQPGVNVSAVARRHGIKPSLLFRWRKKLAKKDARPAAPAFLPISVTAAAKSGDAGCDRGSNEAPGADNRIEIELANGRRVRVGPGVDLGTLNRIIEIVDGRQRP
jgi:transposase